MNAVYNVRTVIITVDRSQSNNVVEKYLTTESPKLKERVSLFI